MEPLDSGQVPEGSLQWQYKLRACVLYSKTTNPTTSNTQERALAPSNYPTVTPPVMQTLIKLHRGSKASSPYSAHIERPASSLHSHDKSSKAPTITRPHRAPAASFTEGQQRVLHLQPIEHLPSSSHSQDKSSNRNKTT